MITPEHQQRFASLAKEIVAFVRFPDGPAYHSRNYQDALRASKCHSWMRDGMESARNDIRTLAEMVNPEVRRKYEQIPLGTRGAWIQRCLDWNTEEDPHGLDFLQDESKTIAREPVSDRTLTGSEKLEAVVLRLSGYMMVVDHYRALLEKSAA